MTAEPAGREREAAERKKFETIMPGRLQGHFGDIYEPIAPDLLDRQENGCYKNIIVEAAWLTWKTTKLSSLEEDALSK